jgi:hypothetical protein
MSGRADDPKISFLSQRVIHMNTDNQIKIRSTWKHAKRVGLLLALCVAGGCMNSGSQSASTTAPAHETMAGEPEPGQPVFNSDEEVADALVAAAKAHDHAKVHQLLGPGWKDLLSGDPVEDTNAFNEFAARATKHEQLERHAGGATILRIGQDHWAYPIPIVKDSEGKWFLDAEAGRHELLVRRIGRNELEAIDVCHILVKAQLEYYRQSRSTQGVATYARHILSTQGTTDGLYWKTTGNAPKSPLEHLIAQAKLEGYHPTPGQHRPYHGYVYHVLTKQGPTAPGGEKDYLVNGHMVNGFAFVAYPVEYGASGIMTFAVGGDGSVFQKDLGPDTDAKAKEIKVFEPDSSWEIVKE